MRSSARLPLLSAAAFVVVFTVVPAAERGAGANQGGRGAPPPPAPRTEPTPPAQAPAPGARAPGARAGGRAPEKPAPQEPAPESPTDPLAPLASVEERATEYFGIADYDANGWIGFGEAQRSLGLDRGGFAVYDKDRDGRIDADEFRVRYEGILARGGAFQPPLKKPEVRKPPRREAAELMSTYDRTPDGGLDTRELERALRDYDQKEPTAGTLLATLDRDASKRLEPAELEALADLLSPRIETESELAKPKARSVVELFGRNVARAEQEGSTHLPPLIIGPVPIFRRLDLDDDGQIELDDLHELQRPVQLHVRLNAVFATLDLDRDGTLSADEFAASMRPKRK